MSNIRKISIVQVFLFIVSVLPVAFCECQNGELLASGLQDEFKAEAVRVHNLLRSCLATGKAHEDCDVVIHQPQAKNLQEMVWDDALAATAQKWANECKFAHDTKQNRFDSRFCVGQNVHIRKSHTDKGPKPDFNDTVYSWFSEEKLYAYKEHVKSPASKKTGHYTQMIWSDSNLVGCGFVYYKDPKEEIRKYKKLYVCNYGPCGNKVGDYPYDSGKPSCNAYSLGWSQYNGLCRTTTDLQSQQSQNIQISVTEEKANVSQKVSDEQQTASSEQPIIN